MTASWSPSATPSPKGTTCVSPAWAITIRWRGYNFGIGGARFEPGVFKGGEFPDADLVTVALGTNDFPHSSPEEFMRNAPAFLARLHERYPAVPTVVITPVWRKAEEGGTVYQLGTMRELRERIAGLCASYDNITVAPGETMVHHHPDFYWDKNLHPADLGHTVYALNLYAFLMKNVL